MHLKTSIFLLNDSVWECLSTFYDNFGHGMLRNPIIYVFCYWRRLVKVVVHVKSCIHATDINSESVRFKSYYGTLAICITMVLIWMDCLNLWHIWQTFKKIGLQAINTLECTFSFSLRKIRGKKTMLLKNNYLFKYISSNPIFFFCFQQKRNFQQ